MKRLLGILTRGKGSNFQVFKQALVYTHSKTGVQKFLETRYDGIFSHYAIEECLEVYMRIEKGVLHLQVKCHLPALISDLRGRRQEFEEYVHEHLQSEGILRSGQKVVITLS